MERKVVLTSEEVSDLRQVLKSGKNVSLVYHGEGADRQVVFSAEGTEFEARIEHPFVEV
jgi:hypothetical protein